MTVRDDLIDALSVCIDRLNSGEDSEAILNDYPTLARQLRPMLEAGRVFERVRYPSADVTAASEAVEPLLRQTIRQLFRGGWGGMGWIVLVLLLGGALIVGIFALNGTPIPASDAAQTAESTAEAPVSIPSETVQDSDSAATTEIPAPTSDSIIIIVGTVTAINANVLTVYDMSFELAPDDPVLTALRIGDALRIEATRSGRAGIIQVIDITSINVTVVVNDGEVWRGGDCMVAPPVWAQSQAGEWYAACTSSPPDSGGGAAPGSRGRGGSGSSG